MATGGLHDPIGVDPREPRRMPAARIVLAIVAAGVAGIVVLAFFRDDGSRGDPNVSVSIERVAPPPSAPVTAVQAAPNAGAEAASVAPGPASPAPSTPPVAAGDQDVEIEHGVRVIRPRLGRSVPFGQVVNVGQHPPSGAQRP